MRTRIRCAMVAALAALLLSGRAEAQTPIFAPGAMQPSTGTGVTHFMPMYRREGADPLTDQQSADEYAVLTQIAYGLTSNLGIQLDVPTVYSDVNNGGGGGGGSSDDEFGLADSSLLLKWRVYQDDPAPAETTRFSLIAGMQLPGNIDGWDWDSSDGWDPIIGAVFSTVRGRHGFNADALWEFYTGWGSDEDEPGTVIRCERTRRICSDSLQRNIPPRPRARCMPSPNSTSSTTPMATGRCSSRPASCTKAARSRLMRR